MIGTDPTTDPGAPHRLANLTRNHTVALRPWADPNAEVTVTGVSRSPDTNTHKVASWSRPDALTRVRELLARSELTSELSSARRPRGRGSSAMGRGGAACPAELLGAAWEPSSSLNACAKAA